MNIFKVAGISNRKGFWLDYKSNRKDKPYTRRKARRNMKRDFQKILQENL